MQVLQSAGGDVLAELLDAEQGSQVRDTGIFRAHAAKYEAEFLEDMTRLGCMMPDVLTRVSEFVEPIIVYIQRIIERGMAYESNGSVYFCTKDFSKTHCYAKVCVCLCVCVSVRLTATPSAPPRPWATRRCWRTVKVGGVGNVRGLRF